MSSKTNLFNLLGPKKSFLAGIVVGLLVIFSVGFFILLGLQLKGSDKLAVNNTNTPTVAPSKNPSPSAAKKPTAKDIQLVPVSDKDWVRGDRNAKISVIEFSDTECPFCKRFHSTMQQVVKEYAGKVNWVYRHFPLTSLHPKAPKEAEATECAGELGGNDGFWEYLDKLFEITPSNNRLDLSLLPQIAEDVGLDRAKFEECLNSGKYAQKVQNDYSQAVAAGGQGTPYSVIVAGDQKIPVSGAVPFAQIKSILDSFLK